MDEKVTKKIDDFFTKYPKRSYPKGQILVFADEAPDHIFYIVDGKVRKYDVSYRGEEVIVNVFKSPAFFPMSWAINRTPNKYFYKTEQPTELHIVPVDEALDFLKSNPDVMLDLLGRIYRGMDGLLGRIVHLMSGNAKSRLIYELVIEALRFGKATGKDSYTLTATELDLAGRSGLTRETVSREMQKLKKEGWLTVGGGVIEIKDISLLEKALGQDA